MIYAAWLVWIVPIVAVPFVPVFDAVGSKARNWFAVATSALTALIGLYLALSFSSSSSEASAIWVPVLNVPVQILVDGTSVMLAVLISFLSFLIGVIMAKQGDIVIVQNYVGVVIKEHSTGEVDLPAD